MLRHWIAAKPLALAKPGRQAQRRLNYDLATQFHHVAVGQVQKICGRPGIAVHLAKQLFAPQRHAIAMLGKGLNLPITAEGIETGDVLAHLLQYGEIKGQGYLFSRPLPADAVEALLLASQKLSSVE